MRYRYWEFTSRGEAVTFARGVAFGMGEEEATSTHRVPGSTLYAVVTDDDRWREEPAPDDPRERLDQAQLGRLHRRGIWPGGG